MSVDTAVAGTDDSGVKPRREQRRHWRFADTSRVEYTVGGRLGISFLGNLSLGGFFLRRADALSAGQIVEFSIFLEDGRPPMVATGEVRECRRGGAHVQFVGEDAAVTERITSFIENVVLPKLDTAVETTRGDPGRVLDLAALYRSLGREDAELDLFRRWSATRSRDNVLSERHAEILVQRVAFQRNAEAEHRFDAAVATLNEAARAARAAQR